MAAISLEQVQQRLDSGVNWLTPRLLRWVGPEARRLRHVLLCLGGLWLLVALSQLIWSLVPAGTSSTALQGPVLNPLNSSVAATSGAPVAVSALVEWHLFGEAGEQTVAEPVLLAPAASPVDDIEEGAKESRLALKLTGIVAMSDEGLGMAIMEHQREQQVYAVGDTLPVGGDRVKLAKVMADRVVIDNSGTYELIRLFDKDSWTAPQQEAAQPEIARNEPSASVPTSEPKILQRTDTTARVLANDYRHRLYTNPQSLANVVKISAERQDGQLKGYRVRPGADAQQFNQLGFKSGDLVTNVNGISLDNPGNAVQLYQVMRTANEAVFIVERAGQELTLTVALGSE